MENNFKKLTPEEKLPERLEEKVMRSIDFAKMIMNVSELFVVQSGKTVTALLDVDIEINKE
jgi:hypothetical protein